MKTFPTRAPIGMLLGAVVGLVSIVPIFLVWQRCLPSLQRFYFPQYIGTTLAQTPVGELISFFHSQRTMPTYFVLIQGGKPVNSAVGVDPVRHVSVRFVRTTPRIFSLWLQHQVYSGREFKAVLKAPVALWVGVGFSLFLCGLAFDFERRKRAREGVQLRGPDLLTRREFNRVTKGNGFTLHVQD